MEPSTNAPNPEYQVDSIKTAYKGRTFYCPKDSMIGECIAEGKGWDIELVPILQFLFKKNASPYIVEVGTNIAGSLLQMEIAVPNARFVCFEPAKRFYSFAERNIRENNWTNVKLENEFMSDRKETIRLNINTSTASAAIDEYKESIRTLTPVGVQTAESNTLDDYFGDSRIDFLKIDTDGYETQVIEGATKLITNSKCTIFFEFDPRMMEQAGADPRKLLGTLRSLGYESYLVLTNFGEAVGVESSHDKLIELGTKTPYYVDLLAVHKDSKIVDRLDELNAEIGNRYTTYPSHTVRPS